jgi:hypothetical protein
MSWTTKEAHAENFASEESKALVAKLGALLMSNGEYTNEVPVGGKFRI